VRASSIGGLLGAIAVVALAGGGTVVWLRDRPAPVATFAEPVLSTTTIRKTDLSDVRLLQGTLGFGSARPVKGTGAGVLTKLPAVGAKATRGTALFRVNDQPVIVFYGDTPLFRPIDKAGLEGRDVRQLRRNLDALGYRSWGPHADVVDASLLKALKNWQKQLELPAPGALRPGQVVVLAGPGRVSTVTAAPGDPADSPVVEVTSTTKVVTVAMGATDGGSLRTGLKVTITLPDGRQVPGTIRAISRTVSGPGNDGEPPKVTVTVTPAKAADVAALDAAPVQVRFATTSRKGVLAVPVGALVALREGGYALQRPDGSLLGVSTGLFANGLVQVSGTGVTSGTTVVTTP